MQDLLIQFVAVVIAVKIGTLPWSGAWTRTKKKAKKITDVVRSQEDDDGI